MRNFEFKREETFNSTLYRLYCDNKPINSQDALIDFSISYYLNYQFVIFQNLLKSANIVDKEEKLDVYKKYMILNTKIPKNLYID